MQEQKHYHLQDDQETNEKIQLLSKYNDLKSSPCTNVSSVLNISVDSPCNNASTHVEYLSTFAM